MALLAPTGRAVIPSRYPTGMMPAPVARDSRCCAATRRIDFSSDRAHRRCRCRSPHVYLPRARSLVWSPFPCRAIWLSGRVSPLTCRSPIAYMARPGSLMADVLPRRHCRPGAPSSRRSPERIRASRAVLSPLLPCEIASRAPSANRSPERTRARMRLSEWSPRPRPMTSPLRYPFVSLARARRSGLGSFHGTYMSPRPRQVPVE